MVTADLDLNSNEVTLTWAGNGNRLSVELMNQEDGAAQTVEVERGKRFPLTRDVTKGVRMRLRDEAGAVLLDLAFRAPGV
jgi:hypothetical protein